MLLTLLISALAAGPAGATAPAGHSPISAYDDPSTWKRTEFDRSKDLVLVLEEYRFGPSFWVQGDHTVPRIYLGDIPARWGKYQSAKMKVQKKKVTFIYVLGPTVLAANEKVALERVELERLMTRRQAGSAWDAAESERLQALATRYGVSGAIGDDATLNELLMRVDIVPPSLVLAQAAMESGWGTSRFAAQGNALFGQWTYGGDGITPTEQRTATKGDYKIRSFATPMNAVSGYLLNLNTHRAYAEMRRQRHQLRKAGKPLSGEALAAGLIDYSERGQAYVDELRALIRRNSLQGADIATLRDMTPILLVPVGDDVDW